MFRNQWNIHVSWTARWNNTFFKIDDACKCHAWCSKKNKVTNKTVARPFVIQHPSAARLAWWSSWPGQRVDECRVHFGPCVAKIDHGLRHHPITFTYFSNQQEGVVETFQFWSTQCRSFPIAPLSLQFHHVDLSKKLMHNILALKIIQRIAEQNRLDHTVAEAMVKIMFPSNTHQKYSIV